MNLQIQEEHKQSLSRAEESDRTLMARAQAMESTVNIREASLRAEVQAERRALRSEVSEIRTLSIAETVDNELLRTKIDALAQQELKEESLLDALEAQTTTSKDREDHLEQVISALRDQVSECYERENANTVVHESMVQTMRQQEGYCQQHRPIF